ncbi:hypothetical protein [Chryseolinea soli]|nr:hypothetical protein [Chryseolinea soli]
MKTLKFFLLWMVMTVVMVITWSVGAWVGNAVTQTVPPPVDDPASVGLSVLLVCLINSLLWSILFWSTRFFVGQLKAISILLYLFGTQFFLMQMETFFFSASLGISPGQVISILLAGLVMVLGTGATGLGLTRKLAPKETTMPFKVEVRSWRWMVVPMLVMSVIVYPLLYETFGYYVAWQNEHLRLFYSHSTELKSFLSQWPGFFSEGIYFFQVLRGVIWVAISIPVVLLLGQNRIGQYVLMGLLSALPAIQLFIPNPYMPADIAMTHFFETFSSDFIWGLLIVYVTNRSTAERKIVSAMAEPVAQA